MTSNKGSLWLDKGDRLGIAPCLSDGPYFSSRRTLSSQRNCNGDVLPANLSIIMFVCEDLERRTRTFSSSSFLGPDLEGGSVGPSLAKRSGHRQNPRTERQQLLNCIQYGMLWATEEDDTAALWSRVDPPSSRIPSVRSRKSEGCFALHKLQVCRPHGGSGLRSGEGKDRETWPITSLQSDSCCHESPNHCVPREISPFLLTREAVEEGPFHRGRLICSWVPSAVEPCL